MRDRRTDARPQQRSATLRLGAAATLLAAALLLSLGGCKGGCKGGADDGLPKTTMVSGIEVVLPVEPVVTDPEGMEKDILRDPLRDCLVGPDLPGCVAIATGDTRLCDEAGLATPRDEAGPAPDCHDFALVHAGRRDASKCDDVKWNYARVMCGVMQKGATFDCDALLALDFDPPLTDEGRAYLRPRCEGIARGDFSVCENEPDGHAQGEDAWWLDGACEVFVAARAAIEGRAELCGDEPYARSCRAMVLQDAAQCFDGAAPGMTADEAVARLRNRCRQFVTGQASGEKAEGEKTKVGALALTRNLFEEKATVKATVTVRQGDEVVDTFTRDVGVLEVDDDPQRFEITFDKPKGATHEIEWVAEWQ